MHPPSSPDSTRLQPPSSDSTWLHPPSSPESTQWMFLDVRDDHQHRRTEKQRPPQRAWDRAFSPDDGGDSTVAGAAELSSRPHSGTGGDEDAHSKFERLTHLERFLHAPVTPDRGAPASRPHSGTTSGFSPDVRSSIGDFSPDLAAHLPSFAAASHPGGWQSAEVTKEVARLKLYVEDAELLSEAAVRLLCPHCAHTRSAPALHPLLRPLQVAAAVDACGGAARITVAERGGAPHARLGAPSERELEGALLALLCSLAEGKAARGGGLERVLLVRCVLHGSKPEPSPNLGPNLDPPKQNTLRTRPLHPASPLPLPLPSWVLRLPAEAEAALLSRWHSAIDALQAARPLRRATVHLYAYAWP